MTADKIKYYDASPNPDHFTNQQIERVIRSLEPDVQAEICPECGHTPETGACYWCKAD